MFSHQENLTGSWKKNHMGCLDISQTSHRQENDGRPLSVNLDRGPDEGKGRKMD
jgi:hypothetical protein